MGDGREWGSVNHSSFPPPPALVQKLMRFYPLGSGDWRSGCQPGTRVTPLPTRPTTPLQGCQGQCAETVIQSSCFQRK